MQNIIIVFSLFFVFLAQPAYSFNLPGSGLGNPLSDEEKKAAFENLNRLQKDINAITAKISQIKKNRLLKKDIRTEGIISLKKPNLVRWEISEPEKTITVVDGEKLTVYHPLAKEAQVYELAENIIASNTINFFSSSFNASLEELEKKFFLVVYRVPENVVFELRPKSKIISKFITSIHICYDEKNGLPSEFEITGAKGDITHTRLREIAVNPELGAKSFTLVLPEDVWITNKIDPSLSN